MAGVKKSAIKAEIGKKFKASEDRIAVFGLKPKFGGGRSSGFVTVYDDADARKKYDTMANLYRVSVVFTTAQRTLSLPRLHSSLAKR
jgi:small subunit ribosomal protein S24e